MSAATPERVPSRRLVPRVAATRFILWLAFIVVHFWLGFLNLFAPGLPLGDVTFVYKGWAQEASSLHYYVGIDGVWVYPIVALLPIIAAATFGFAHYVATWLSLVFVLDAVAFAALIGWRGPLRNRGIAWWWIAFLVLLGPIAMGRIDSITIPLGIVAALALATRPRVAAVLLTIAMWVKVWPAAMIAAIVIAARERRHVLVASLGTSAIIILVALLFGAGGNVFSFISQQTGRGLQVEAPISTVWMWLAYAHVPGAFVYYDQGILTYQVGGPGAAAAAAVMTVVLVLAVLAIASLGALAAYRRVPAVQSLPALALAFIAAFIAFNKVGSPQYMTWLAVPIILGFLYGTAAGREFRTPAILALVIAALTQIIYPYVYINLLELNPLLLSVLTARNLLMFVLLGWAVRSLTASVRRAGPLASSEVVDHRSAARWPLGGTRVPAPTKTAGLDGGMLDERFGDDSFGERE